jgi:very-short-patch-repair endonuclease
MMPERCWNVRWTTHVELVTVARALRRYATTSERELWRALRGHALGAHFRRQAVVGPFVVDFLQARSRLVVEVDGAVHDAAQARDAARQAALERAGYRVLRFTATEVERDLPRVLSCIASALLPPPLRRTLH